jgi:hypothetical protein
VTPPHIVIKKRFPHFLHHLQKLIPQIFRIFDSSFAVFIANEPIVNVSPEIVLHQKKVDGKLHHVRTMRPTAARHWSGFQFNRDDPAGAIVEKIVGFAAEAVATGNEYSIIFAVRILVKDLSTWKAALPAKVPRNEQAKGGQYEEKEDEWTYSHIWMTNQISAVANAINPMTIPTPRRRSAQ